MYSSKMTCAFILALCLCSARSLWNHSVLERSTSVAQGDMYRPNQPDGGYNHSCVTPIEDRHAPVNMRSTCPWYYETDHVMQVQVAKLKCDTSTYCLTAQGQVGPYECASINQAVDLSVQKRSENGTFVYENATYHIPVGYTCSGKRM